MTFDLRTIYAMTAIACIVLGMIQGVAYVVSRFDRWLAFWSASSIIVGIGSLCIAFRGIAPNFVTTEIGNGVTIIGSLLLPVSVRLFAGRRVGASVVLILMVGLNLPFLFMTAPDQWSARVTLGSLIFSVIDLTVAFECYRLWRAEKVTSALFTALLFIVTSSLYGSRGFLAWAGLLGKGDLFEAGNVFHAWLGMTALLFVTLRSMLILLMGMERANMRLQDAAYRDALTGVLNRGGLIRSFSAITTETVAVLIVDLDRFKDLNDSCGHALGDDVLRSFANAAGSVVGPGDLVARHGGDEFVVVLTERSLEQAALLAENIRIAFSLRTAKLDVALPIRPTLSIGAAAQTAGVPDLHELLHQADQALYQRKRDGRDGVDIFRAELAA